MSAIDAAAAKVTELAMTDRIRVDPADPWCDIWNPPPSVYKERCIHTGYLMTKPFEQNNPMPGQFSGTSDYIVAMLKPVIKTKGGAFFFFSLPPTFAAGPITILARDVRD